jgi:hypothetical protein
METENKKVTIGGYPPKVEISGNVSWGYVGKACLPCLVVIGGWYFFKSYAYYWLCKKKKESGLEVSKQNTTINPATNPVTLPKAETLNEVCAKPRVGYDDLQLCGKLLCKGDTLVIYSSDGEGKSTLAMDMCIGIANGSKTHLLSEQEVPSAPRPQRVYYFDAELSDDDIKMRFNPDYHYPDNLKRISHVYSTVQELFDSIESFVYNGKSDVTICIDNLSAIIPTSSANAYRDLFLRQNSIKEKARADGFYVIFIIITHTTKTVPGRINENFYGSAYLGNLSASRIALLPTRFGEDYKMLKVQKNRKMPKDGNVIVVKRVTTPYLHFEYHDVMQEAEAAPLKQKTIKISSATPTTDDLIKKQKAPNQKVTHEKEEKIIAMLYKGMKQSAIANKLRLSTKTVHRTIARLKTEGRISA